MDESSSHNNIIMQGRQRRYLRELLIAAVACLVIAGCDSDSGGLEAVDLQGTWTASVYEYTENTNPQNVVDIIQRDGASFQLTVDASGVASTVLDDGLGSTSSDSGTLNSEATILTLNGIPFSAVRDGDLLTLVNDDRQFDFGSGSSTSATLRIVLRRG